MWTSLSSIIERIIGWACEAVLYVTTAAIFLILSTNVILRYTTGASLQWASELPELLFPWLVLSGVVLAAQHGTHIAVVILTQRLPQPMRRHVLAFGGIIVVGLYLLLAWSASELIPIAADELSPMLKVPGSVTISALLLGFVLIALLTLINVVRAWHGAPLTSASAHEVAHP